ncbi:hypothetical protein MRX96_002130 [Rhipicephalus microplus]
MYAHLTPFCYIVQISTVIASCTSPLPGAASAHPVAFLDKRFNQTLRSPDFPACQPSGLRVRECLPVLDPPQLSASTDASTGSYIKSWIFGRPFSGHGTSAKMYAHLTPFFYIVHIPTVIASCTSPLPGAASAHPVAFLDMRFNETLRLPDFPACQPSGLRVRECLPLLDPPQLSASTDASTGSYIRSSIFGRPFSGHGTSAKMYTHLTPFCYIVQISTAIASCTSPLPGAASAHPVAFLDMRFNQTLQSPDFPACQLSGLRVRECLQVLDPPQLSASTDASTGSYIRSWIFGRPFTGSCLTWCAVVVNAVADESKPSSKHPPKHPARFLPRPPNHKDLL